MDTSTSVYDYATSMFPGSDNTTKIALNNILRSFELLLPCFLTCTWPVRVSISSTRKAMRISSIMSIMIGVAVCDFVTMVSIIATDKTWFDESGTDCTPPATLFAIRLAWLFITIRDMVRRSSTWLGVLMALIRLLVIRFSTSHRIQKLSEPAFGLYSVFGCFSISTLFSLAYYFRYEFMEEGTWRPMKNCTDIPLDTVLPITNQKPSVLFSANNGIIGKTYMFVNGIVSKIVPCILLPILTFLLILELRRADKLRRNSNFTKQSSSERTTGLVTFMTVLFFIVELPIGVALVFQVAYTDMGYVYLATYVSHICHAIFIVNATIHCLICFLMSSQYRSTVGGILGIRMKTVTQPPTNS